MRLGLIYNKTDYKLSDLSYSKNYRDLFDALITRFGDVQHVCENCSADDISADVIVFFDPHSSHHIDIPGICNHPAVKYEYYNDPHQPDFTGKYINGPAVKKLGAKNRTARTLRRGVHYIICPVVSGYMDYIAPHLGRQAEDMLFWFPIVPAVPDCSIPPLENRKYGVLANGHTWQGTGDFKPYDFRSWAYKRKNIFLVPHWGADKRAPVRENYMEMLTLFKGGLALCDVYPVAKYFEIPLMGCVCFMQYLPECDKLGFEDDRNCIFVDRRNFDGEIANFLSAPQQYQKIADAGRKLVLANWTAEKFADAVYKHAESRINGKCNI